MLVNQQNAEKLITIIGGSGFLGRHIVRALAKRGYRIRVACRRPDLAGHLQPLGDAGQIMPVQANVRYPASLAAACDGRLCGDQPDRRALFRRRPELRCRPCLRRGGLRKGRQGGAGAGLHPDVGHRRRSRQFGRHMPASKAEGEARARAAFPGAIILRPSIVFGPEDQLLQPLRRPCAASRRPCR